LPPKALSILLCNPLELPAAKRPQEKLERQAPNRP